MSRSASGRRGKTGLVGPFRSVAQSSPLTGLAALDPIANVVVAPLSLKIP